MCSMGTELEPAVIENVSGWANVDEGTNILSIDECLIVFLTCNLNAIYVRRWFISSNYMDKKNICFCKGVSWLLDSIGSVNLCTSFPHLSLHVGANGAQVSLPIQCSPSQHIHSINKEEAFVALKEPWGSSSVKTTDNLNKVSVDLRGLCQLKTIKIRCSK